LWVWLRWYVLDFGTNSFLLEVLPCGCQTWRASRAYQLRSTLFALLFLAGAAKRRLGPPTIDSEPTTTP